MEAAFGVLGMKWSFMGKDGLFFGKGMKEKGMDGIKR
jgi:hypothetical protein